MSACEKSVRGLLLEAALALGLSPESAEWHVKRICDRLGVGGNSLACGFSVSDETLHHLIWEKVLETVCSASPGACELQDLKLSEIREVVVCFVGREPVSYLVPAKEVEQFVEATRRLHFDPGVNPHQPDEQLKTCTKIWLIEVRELTFKGPHWWTMPSLGCGDTSAGARLIVGDLNRAKTVLIDPGHDERMPAVEAAVERAQPAPSDPPTSEEALREWLKEALDQLEDHWSREGAYIRKGHWSLAARAALQRQSTSRAVPSVMSSADKIEAAARKVIDIQADLDEFDGDRRGPLHSLREALCDLADALPGAPKLERPE